LLFRLNAILGRTLVKSIELRVDPKTLASVSARETGKGSRTLDYKVPAELLSAAAGIEDAELRRVFLGAATSCVRRLEEPEIRNPNGSEPPA
jgi:hypothetical protein